ncbi:MAG TPA: hypothetical protein VK775_20010 [Chthoniobacterales bacterium]|jgi:hypothetical protein|nr:hypothetical protein [Chthoniobacterales bacterium]
MLVVLVVVLVLVIVVLVLVLVLVLVVVLVVGFFPVVPAKFPPLALSALSSVLADDDEHE